MISALRAGGRFSRKGLLPADHERVVPFALSDRGEKMVSVSWYSDLVDYVDMGIVRLKGASEEDERKAAELQMDSIDPRHRLYFSPLYKCNTPEFQQARPSDPSGPFDPLTVVAPALLEHIKGKVAIKGTSLAFFQDAEGYGGGPETIVFDMPVPAEYALAAVKHFEGKYGWCLRFKDGTKLDWNQVDEPEGPVFHRPVRKGDENTAREKTPEEKALAAPGWTKDYPEHPDRKKFITELMRTSDMDTQL